MTNVLLSISDKQYSVSVEGSDAQYHMLTKLSFIVLPKLRAFTVVY